MSNGRPRSGFNRPASPKAANRDNAVDQAKIPQIIDDTSNVNQQTVETNRVPPRQQPKNVTYEIAESEAETSDESCEGMGLGKSLSFHPSLALIRVFSKYELASTAKEEEQIVYVDNFDDSHSNDEFSRDRQRNRQLEESNSSVRICLCALKKNEKKNKPNIKFV